MVIEKWEVMGKKRSTRTREREILESGKLRGRTEAVDGEREKQTEGWREGGGMIDVR